MKSVSPLLSLLLLVMCLSATSLVAYANTPPTFTTVNTLANGHEDSDYSISYGTLTNICDAADADGDALSFRVEQVLSGTLKKNGTAVTPGTTLLSSGETLTWRPAAYDNGTISAFTLVAYDGTDASTPPVTVNINVLPFDNTATLDPIADQTINEDSNLSLTLTGISSGAPNEDQNLTISTSVQSVTGAPSPNVTATVNYTSPQSTGVLTVTPAPNAYGPVYVTVTVSDGHTPSPNYPRTDKRTFYLNVLSVNDAPTLDALPDLTVNEDSGPITVNLSGITSGASNENQFLSVSASFVYPPYLLTSPNIPITYTSPQTTGSLTLNLSPNVSGSSVFTVRVYDGQTTTTRTFNFTVLAVNDPPTLTTMNPLRSTNEDVPYTVTFSALTFEGNEADVDGPSMNFRIERVLAGTMTQNGQPIVPGQTIINANQSVVWTPPANQNGDIPAFTVRAWDTIDASSTEVMVPVRVIAVNDAPVPQTFTSTTPEDTPLNFTLSATDVENDPLTFTITQQPAASVGTITGTSPNFTFTPAPNYWGNGNFAAFFTYSVSDGSATVFRSGNSITITSVNDAPTLTTMNPLKGGTEDQSYVVSFNALATEGNEADIDSSTLSFRIEEVVSGTMTQNGQPVVPGQTLITTNLGATWTPPANANGNVLAFRVRAYDGSLASATPVDVYVMLAAVNDAPVAQGSTFNGTEDTPLPLNLNASDVDGDALTYEFVELNGATITGTAPNFTYNPVPNRNGAVYFYFRVNDGKTYSSSQTSAYARVDINLAPVADAPTLTAVNALTGGKEDTNFYISHYTLWLNANEYHPDYPSGSQPILSFRVEDVLSGTLTKGGQPVVPGQTILAQADANYPLVWTPPANANGTINAFTVKAWDGTNASATAVPVPVIVAPVNDAPTVQNVSVVTDEDTPVEFTISATDVDEDTLTYSIMQQTGAGTISGTGPTFTFTPNANFSGQTGFSFTVSDGTATVSRQGNITVNSVNDAPTLSTISTITGAVQGKPLNVSRTQLQVLSDVADIDNQVGNLQFRVESIESGTLTSNGQTVQPGFIITDGSDVTWTAPTDALGVTTGFTVKAWDGAASSANAVPVKFDVALANNVPQAQAQDVALNEDTTANITIAATDADGDALTYSIYIPPSHGTLSGTLPNVIYTPDANFNGADSFWFTANDGRADSQPAAVSITINSINDAPTISSIEVGVGREDLPIGFPAHVLIGKTVASDVDGNPIYLKVESLGGGKLQIGNVDATVGRPIYPNDYLYWQPPANANGDQTIATLRAFDGSLSSANAVPWKVILSPVNDAPTAQSLTLASNEDQSAQGTLAGIDIDNDALTCRITQQPAHGTFTGTLPAFTYTPEANYFGADSFQFVVNDGTIDSAPATVNLQISAVNDAPTLTQISTLTGTFEDTPFDISFATLQNAADEADVDSQNISFRIESIEAGTLTKNGVAVTQPTLFGAGDTLQWTPPIDANGTGVAFTLKAWDGQLTSATAVPVRIAVEAASDAPVAQNQSLSTNEDTAANVNLSATDADGDTLTYTVVAAPKYGTLTGTAPNLTYTPNANYNGSDSFTFKANDGAIDSNVATVSINVVAQNDAPVAQNQTVTTNEDTATIVTLTGSDIENDALTFSITQQPAHGTLTGTAPNVTYKPAANFNGADSFSFKANDGVADSNAATVNITVTAVNDAPTMTRINQRSGNEDTGFHFAASYLLADSDAADVDNISLKLRVESLGGGRFEANGVAITVGQLLSPSDDIFWQPPANANGLLTVCQLRAWDGSLASAQDVPLVYNLAPVNDRPVADGQVVSAVEDTAKSFTLTGSDVDGDALTYRITQMPTHGTLTGTAPNLTYTPQANYNSFDAVKFVVNDGVVDSAEATVTIMVDSVNDAPTLTAVTDFTGVQEDTDLTVPYADLAAHANEADIDTANLSFRIESISNGTIKINGAAASVGALVRYQFGGDVLTWTPTANANGTLTAFNVTAWDGALASSPAVPVRVVVTPVNDAPTAANQTVNATEDTQANITLNANDVDGNALTYTIVSNPTRGTLSGSGANRTYTPALNYNGTDSFTFKVNDGTVDSNTATVTINIAAVNDIPTLTTVSPLTGGVEDAPFTITYATLAAAGNEADVDTTTLLFRVEAVISGTLTKNGVPVNAGSTLLASGESLVWTPAVNANGSLTAFSVKAWDGAAASLTAVPVIVTTAAVNDAPSFALNGTAQSVKKNAQAQTVAGWAKNLSAGPTDESAQTLSFTTTNDNTSLFNAQPTLAANGTLTYTPAKNKTGTATVSVKLQDSGGTTNGGVNTSATQTFTITIN